MASFHAQIPFRPPNNIAGCIIVQVGQEAYTEASLSEGKLDWS